MIFAEILDTIHFPLSDEIDRLFELSKTKQAHSSDLLLIHVNGFYDENVLEYDNLPQKFSPYLIGSGMGGFSWSTHDSFIRKYRDYNQSNTTLEDYKKLHEWTQERGDEIKMLREVEAFTIQLEMLIYLKIWEAEFLIKKLYQLARILHCEPYDWHFRLSESSRDKYATGTTQEIILKKIRDKIEPHSPYLFKLIKDCYKTQIRNSIAHSNYSMLNRDIYLGNYVKGDRHSQLKVITFDEWIDIFHKSLMLHNAIMRLSRLINDHYGVLASQNNQTVSIRITERDCKQYDKLLDYTPQVDRWSWK